MVNEAAAFSGTTAKGRRVLETKPNWPRIIDAPFRDVMPGIISLGSFDVLEAQREDWEAPWMVGLVDRVAGVGTKGGGFDNTASVDGVDEAPGETNLSDLHNEIVRFSEYVSLTLAEVRRTTVSNSKLPRLYSVGTYLIRTNHKIISGRSG